MRQTRQNRIVIAIIISVFICYNFIVYTTKPAGPQILMSEDALAGEKIWQDNNCTACHQFYGLGGYLGPDLTNVYSKYKHALPTFFNNGPGVNEMSMPKFDFDSTELAHLTSFLKHVDRTGYYPNIRSEFNADGWVSIEYK